MWSYIPGAGARIARHSQACEITFAGFQHLLSQHHVTSAPTCCSGSELRPDRLGAHDCSAQSASLAAQGRKRASTSSNFVQPACVSDRAASQSRRKKYPCSLSKFWSYAAAASLTEETGSSCMLGRTKHVAAYCKDHHKPAPAVLVCCWAQMNILRAARRKLYGLSNIWFLATSSQWLLSIDSTTQSPAPGASVHVVNVSRYLTWTLLDTSTSHQMQQPWQSMTCNGDQARLIFYNRHEQRPCTRPS